MKRYFSDSGVGTTLSPPKPKLGRDRFRPSNHEEMAKKAEAAGRPAQGHKALEHFVGSWKAEVKCWSEPGVEPAVTQATAKAKWILNGRFLEEDFYGDMMGKPFHGRLTLGYDNLKHTFNSVWLSDVQTSMFTSEGRGEDANQTLILHGLTSCPATERTDIPTKLTLLVLGPNRHILEMYDCSGEEETKMMEIIYTRV
jgi:hypothetical protein